MALKVKRRGGRLQLSGTIEGQRIRQAMGLPASKIKVAKQQAARIELEAMAHEASGITVEMAARTWARRPDKPGQTSQDYVARFAEDFGEEDLLALDEGEIYDAYVGSGKAVTTVQRELGSVQAFLSWSATRYGLGRTFKLMKPGGSNHRLRFLEEEEVRRFVHASPQWFLPVVLALFYMGLRRGELMRARWRDLHNGELVVATRKGRRGKVRYRRVPVHPVLAPYLAKGGSPDGFIFTKHDGTPYWSEHRKDHGGAAINHMWEKIGKLAKIEDCTPHDARRTFASMLLDRDVDLRTIADLLGHTSLALLMIYAQVRGKRRAKSVELLPDVMKSPKARRRPAAATAKVPETMGETAPVV